MSLIIKHYPKVGRGVCSTAALRSREIVEIAPVLVLSARDWKSIKGTRIEAYVFAWGKTGRLNAVPLGYGGLYNHSDSPNMAFFLNHAKQTIMFRAKRNIPAGEQLTINYGWTKKVKRRWFASSTTKK